MPGQLVPLLSQHRHEKAGSERKSARTAGRRTILKRTDVTYGQLDQVLRSLAFSCWLSQKEPLARVYQHESGALFTTPPFPLDDFVLDSHLVAARTILDLFGIADPKGFDAQLRKAG